MTKVQTPENRNVPHPDWLMSYVLDISARVNATLEASLESGEHNETLVSAMRYSLLGGGKRICPVMVIACYELFAGRGVGSDFEKSVHLAPVMPTAAAFEMIHTMSLIHDDLPAMDDDDVRRGKPSNHKVYGEAVAILAGDALLAYAFEFIARHSLVSDGASAQRIVKVITLLAESVGANGVAGGQVRDLEAEGMSSDDMSLETVKWIHTKKTAVLLRAACMCGAIFAGGSEQDIHRLGEFAMKAGLAFQIIDDILDVTQSSKMLGKTAGKDESVNKATYPRLLGLEQSRSEAQRLITEAKMSLQSYGERADTLIGLADFIMKRES